MKNPASNQQSVPPQNQSENKESEATFEEVVAGRLAVSEQLLNELLKGFGMAGQAVNRLESFTFSLVALLLKKEIATIEEIRELQEQLQGHDDLNVFWGVEPPEGADPADVGTEDTATEE